jgi:hypothetical protein
MEAGPNSASARALDWRFLLPAPRGRTFDHLLLLGGSDGLAAAACDLGVARRVSTTVRAGAGADAAVVLAGATESVETAADALGDEGVLYWEVDRRSSPNVWLTPARAARRLGRLGLNTFSSYWVKPGFPERQMYLPLSAPRALRWYLQTLYRSTTALRRALKSGLGALAASTNGLAAFAPCYAVTGGRGSARPPALLEGTRGTAGWNGDRVDPVFLAHGGADWNRIAVLVFEDNAPAPSAAIKVARRAAFNRQIEWEHLCLRQLARLAPPLRRSVPSSSLLHWNELAVSIETCVGGAALSSRITGEPARAVDDLRLLVDWLAAFHRETTTSVVPAASWVTDHLVNGLRRDYEATFGVTAAEGHLFAALAQSIGTTELGTLPIVRQHTDLGPWNVYRDGGEISVIDWEVARRGPALADLLYFATHWSSAVDGHTSAEGRLAHFESLFCTGGDDTSGHCVGRAVRTYMQRLGMDTALLPYLLVYTILEQALDRANRFAELRAVQPGRDGNRYVQYLSVLARHAGMLFPAEVRRVA